MGDSAANWQDRHFGRRKAPPRRDGGHGRPESLRFASRGITEGGKFALAAIPLLFASCASAPPAAESGDWPRQRESLEALDAWQFRGRVNVRYQNESHTPRILWRQRQRTYDIRLWGSFNAGNTRIIGDPEGVTLESDGEVLSAATPEDLIHEQLGYELPVSQLEYWIKGLPAPGGEAELLFNERDQLAGIWQQGWSISYPDPRQYGELNLPGEIEVLRSADDVRLRFVGMRWSLGE